MFLNYSMYEHEPAGAETPLPGFERLIRPVDIQPWLAAEEIPLETLEAITPARPTLARASGLIEQSFHGEPDRLDEAAGIIEKIKFRASEAKSARARFYEAYLPVFAARSAQRQPSRDEVLDTFGHLHALLIDSHTFITSDRESEQQNVDDEVTDEIQSDAINATRQRFVGWGGEATVAYLSAYNALRGTGELLFPSSGREDNPVFDEVARHYKREVHDMHTYNPAAPGARAVLSLTVRSPFRPSANTRFNVLSQAQKFQQDPELRFGDLLSLLLAAEGTEASRRVEGQVLRDYLAAELQQAIESDMSNLEG